MDKHQDTKVSRSHRGTWKAMSMISEAFRKLAGLKLERSDHWCELAPFKVMYPKIII